MPVKQIKVGIDLHGVCDRFPHIYAAITQALVDAGHEVHLMTGSRMKQELRDQLKDLGIAYTHFFSISDYHHSIGTDMYDDADGNPWIDDKVVWDRTKADYAKRVGIDLIIDDTLEYSKYGSTPFLLQL